PGAAGWRPAVAPPPARGAARRGHRCGDDRRVHRARAPAARARGAAAGRHDATEAGSADPPDESGDLVAWSMHARGAHPCRTTRRTVREHEPADGRTALPVD